MIRVLYRDAMLRALPAMVLTAASEVGGREIGCFVFAMSSHWARVIEPTLSCGLGEPLSMLGGLLDQEDAGASS